jgi:hypothetical protein
VHLGIYLQIDSAAFEYSVAPITLSPNTCSLLSAHYICNRYRITACFFSLGGGGEVGGGRNLQIYTWSTLTHRKHAKYPVTLTAQEQKQAHNCRRFLEQVTSKGAEIFGLSFVSYTFFDLTPKDGWQFQKYQECTNGFLSMKSKTAYIL